MSLRAPSTMRLVVFLAAVTAYFSTGSSADPLVRSLPLYANHTSNSTALSTTSGATTTSNVVSTHIDSTSHDGADSRSSDASTSTSVDSIPTHSEMQDSVNTTSSDDISTNTHSHSRAQDSSTISTQTTKGIGAFIAAGLGISSSIILPGTASATANGFNFSQSHQIQSASSLFTSNLKSPAANATKTTSNHTVHPSAGFLASHGINSATIHSSNHLIHPTGSLGSFTSHHNSTHHNNSTNNTCWAEWNKYWDLVRPTKVITLETTYTEIFSDFTILPLSPWSYTTEIVTDLAGTYIVDTYTITQPVTDTESYSIIGTSTFTDQYESSVPRNPHATTPACVLPSSVPDCQSSWDFWATHQYGYPTYADDVPSSCYWYNTTLSPKASKTCDQEMSSAYAADDAWYAAQSSLAPLCTQASIGGSVCSNLRDNFVSLNGGSGMWQSTPRPWPGSKMLAPSCTVGCGTCRVTGGTVQLLYWPPATSSASPGQVVTATGYGTTFTSPTVYISFDSLYASDFCSAIGTTIQNTILPITNSATLSSIWGWEAGGFDLPSASFNFTDLYQTPVPQSIYTSQVWCAYYKFVEASNMHGKPFNFTCDERVPYAPIIDLPIEIRDADPAWANCVGALNGAYDPPQALQAATAEAVPTLPGGGSPPATTTPAPGHTPTPSQSHATSAPAGQSDQLPSTSLNQPQQPNSSTTKAVGGNGNQSPPKQSPSSPSQDPPSNGNQNSNNQNSNNQNSNNQNSNNQNSNNQNSNNQNSNNQNSNSQNQKAPDQNDQNNSLPNALSVLESAVNSAANNANTPAPRPGSSANGNPESDPNSPGQDSDPVTIPVSNGPAISASPQGGSALVVNHGGSQTTIQAGQQGVVSGHTISVGSSASSIVVDGSTHAFASPGTTPAPAPAAVLSADGQFFTASAQGKNVVVAVGGSSVTLADGSATTIAGQSVSVLPEGSGLVVGSQTLAIPQVGAASLGLSAAAVWADNGKTFAAIPSGDSVIITEGSSTITLADGAVTTIDGETISALPSGQGLVIDGSSTLSLATTTSSNDGAVTFTADGHSITATEISGAVVMWDGSRTITIKEGSSTMFEGETVSVPSDGGAVVVDGTTSAFSKSVTATTIGVNQNDASTTAGTLPTNRPTPASSSASRDGYSSILLLVAGLGIALVY